MWSLGATLFYVLSGRPPYDVGDNVMSSLYRIVNEDPPRLPEAGPLAPLLEATLVKDPAQRWSMAQVRDFLVPPGPAQDQEATEVLSAGPAPPRGPDRRSPTRRPAARGPQAPRRRCCSPALVSSCAAPGRGPDRPPQRRGLPSRTTPRRPPTSSPSTQTTAAEADRRRDGVLHPRLRRGRLRGSRLPPARCCTPSSQQESGGLDTYRGFWDSATDGRVLYITPNPESPVSYQVHFDNSTTAPARPCST